MPGPPPKRHVRRTNARPDWVQLPADGCKRPVPDWPLPKKATRAEAQVWEQLWHTPQAEMWHKLGWTRIVARYAQKLILAERPTASTTQQAEVRQFEDRLGLSPMALKRLFWEMSTDAEEATGSSGPQLASVEELYGKAK